MRHFVTYGISIFILSIAAKGAFADCQLRDVFFGQTEIQIVTHEEKVMPGIRYETGIIVSNDGSGKILGQLNQPERDKSRLITNSAGDGCGYLQKNLVITDGDIRLRLRKAGSNSFIVLNGSSPVGTIEGRLNNDEDKASDPAALARLLKHR